MSIRTVTQEDPIGLAGGLNLYGFAGGDPINFADPFGLCPEEETGEPCTAGGMTVRPGVTVSSSTVLTGIGRIAEMTNLHASVHGGDRTTNPRGSFDRSEHRIDTGGKGAADFHLFNPDGTQVNDATAAKLVLEAGGVPEGTRLIYHGPQTNTQAEHLHLDTRVDKGNAIENLGRWVTLTVKAIRDYLPGN